MLSYQNCRLCPRECGVDRTAGEKGFCRMPAQVQLAEASLHFGEEPVISGDYGAGAVFFSGCTMGCRFCQNREISAGCKGKAPTDLRKIFENLIDEGAQTIDLVTPTHFLPDILLALEPKLPVPVVYNCGGYEKVETLRELEGKVDVYLPDFKYSDDALAGKLSAAPDYFEVASQAILEMYRQVGDPVIEDGVMKKGVLLRHLVLPGCLDNTLGVIEWVGTHFPGGKVLFSLMSQYIPMGNLPAPFDRRITREEYEGALSWMELYGIDQGFTQDFTSATTEYIPEFNFDGVI